MIVAIRYYILVYTFPKYRMKLMIWPHIYMMSIVK
jgi:hypothetical protein